MRHTQLPCQNELLEYFKYCQDTGKLYWIKKTGRGTRIGSEVGNQSAGYLQTSFKGRRFLVHRIAWKMHYGTEPRELDHINGNRSDNRIENLREVDRALNTKNKRLRGRNETGHYGVVKHSQVGWVAQIGVGGKTKYLGWFATKQEAIDARKAAEKQYGYHENHGNVKKE